MAVRDLNATGLWHDEEWSIYDAGGAHFGPLSPAGIWQRVAIEDPTETPGYSLVLAGWGALVGWSEYAGRALSLLAGLLAVAMMYRLAYALEGSNPIAGLGAAVAVGAGTFFIYYLHEMRVYTLYALVTILCIWCYWWLITRHPYWWMQTLFAVSIAALLYLHYFGALTLIFIGLYHLLFAPGSRRSWRWWRVSVLLGVGALCFVPWLSAAVPGAAQISRTPRVAVINLFDVAGSVGVVFSNGSLVLLFGLALATLLKPNRAAGFAWFWLISSAILSALTISQLHINAMRYLIGLWPALALLMGLGIARLRRFPTLWIGLWLITGISSTKDAGLRQWFHIVIYHQPTREAASALYGRVRDGDIATYHLPTDIESYTQDRVFAYYTYPLTIPGKVVEASSNASEENYVKQAQTIVGNAERVWITYYHWLRPERETLFEGVLNASNYRQCGGFTTVPDSAEKPQIDVKLFIRFPQESQTPALRFDDGIEIHLVKGLFPAHNQPDRTLVLPVVLNISLGANVLRGTYSVALHIENSAGQRVAQADYGLEEGCQATDIPIATLPPGQYTVLAAVYNWQTAERLPPSGYNGREDRRLVVGSFRLH